MKYESYKTEQISWLQDKGIVLMFNILWNNMHAPQNLTKRIYCDCVYCPLSSLHNWQVGGSKWAAHTYSENQHSVALDTSTFGNYSYHTLSSKHAWQVCWAH